MTEGAQQAGSDKTAGHCAHSGVQLAAQEDVICGGVAGRDTDILGTSPGTGLTGETTVPAIRLYGEGMCCCTAMTIRTAA